MKNGQILAGQSSYTTIRKSVDLPLAQDKAEEFLVDTVKHATTLQKLDPKYKKAPSGKLDKLSVKSRKIREHTGEESPTGTGGIISGQVNYTAKKVYWDEWIKNDDVYVNQQLRGEDIELKVMNLVQKQFGVDLQDLLFNGDTTALLEDGVTLDPFLSILDGFVKRMKASTLKTDLGTDEPTIKDFTNHALLLDEKYLNMPDTTWLMSQRSYLKIVAMVQDRPTALGDATITNGKLVGLSGFPIEVVQTLESKFIALTPMSNLVPVLIRDLRYKRTTEGATAAIKDASYHIIFSQADAVVLEKNAVAWMTGEKL